MKKFIALKVTDLRFDNLAGLVTESIEIADRQKDALGPVAAAKLQELSLANDTFRQWLNIKRASSLTPQIAALDNQRDAAFREIRHTAKAAQKSVVAAMSAAGVTLMELLRPIWNVNKEHLVSQTEQFAIFIERVAADPAATAALEPLGLASVFAALTEANTRLRNLYNARLDEKSVIDGHSASGNSRTVAARYREFCAAVALTLSVQPTDALQTVFNEMNDLRRKYI
jgi:hypothetical protein